MTRRLGAALLCAAIAACGGGSKKGTTTPGGGTTTAGGGAADSQSMTDTGPVGAFGDGPATATGASAPGPGTAGGAMGGTTYGGATAGGAADGSGPAISYPNFDPDPQQAKAQVDQHLSIARHALEQATPDPDTALHEAREALKVDASSLDAAAYVAFAYYYKKQYDTAELVLDDLFKRDAAKQHAGIYYVYGLVYDHTNRPERAVLAYQRAVELAPNFSSALVNLGMHQLLNKQYDKAQATFEQLTTKFHRQDAVTLTSLGSAYRGRSAEYPTTSGDRNRLIMSAEAAYKRAIAANANYGPAYYNLALLYLDADPFPSAAGPLDTLQRLQASKTYLDQYKNAPGVDIKLYDERMKDVTKAIKREEKKRKKAKKKAGGS